MTPQQIERKIAQIEERWKELDRAIWDLNKMLALTRRPQKGNLEWENLYREIEDVEAQLAELRKKEQP